jgi:hypothetical protein
MIGRLAAPSAWLLIVLASLFVCGCGGGNNDGGSGSGAITSVAVNCAEPTLPVGLIDSCWAQVHGTGSFNAAVTWTTTAGTVDVSGLLTLPDSTGPVIVTATAVGDTTKSGSATVTVTAAQHAAFTDHGVNHVSWSAGEYASPAGATSEDALAATGTGWAGVLVTWYQADAHATTIAPQNYSPTDNDVISAITELHNQGVKVMLKPHIDALDGSWRGTFQPSDPDAWFASFTNFIVHWAQIAQAQGVEMLCFGTEYAQLTGAANLTRWTAVVNTIRSNYTGSLAYAANATYGGDEFTSVAFWSQVDVMGLDAYFPLTNHSDPTLAELVQAWSHNKNGENIVAAVSNFAGAHPGKPVIFTEIGYRSLAGANTAPWDWSVSGTADNMEQQLCYEAVYEVWSQHTSAMTGNFWWAWPVPAPASGDTDYNPRNKPAQTVLRNWN